MVQSTNGISRANSWSENKRESLMSNVKEMTQSPSCCTRHFSASIVSSVGGFVTNSTVAVSKVLALPFVITQVPVKLLVKTTRILFDAQCLQKLDSKLCGISDIFKTALKAIGSAFAALFSLTIGFLSPRLNVLLHELFGFLPSQDVSANKPTPAKSPLDLRDRELELLRLLELSRLKREEALRGLEAQREAQASAEAARAAQSSAVAEVASASAAAVQKVEKAVEATIQEVEAILEESKPAPSYLDSIRSFGNDFVNALTA